MRLFVILYIVLHTQLSGATPSKHARYLGSIHRHRSSSDLSAGLSDRSLTHQGKPFIAGAWYPSWLSTQVPLSEVNFTQYSHLAYAFVATTPDPSNLNISNADGELIDEFVKTTQRHGKKAIIGLGGWGGSRFFSSNVANGTNRAAFAEAIIEMIRKYGCDGIDIDWEYPNAAGIGCNQVSKEDSANYLKFLQALRRRLRKNGLDHISVSASVSLKPFFDQNGVPMADVSEFAKVLNYITIMAYDVFGYWNDVVGPNGPVRDSCAAPALQQGSADPGKALDDQGKLRLYPSIDKSRPPPPGDKWDTRDGEVDACGVKENHTGVLNFWAMVENGFLDRHGNAAKGIDYTFDNCSETPFVYNKKSEVMVSFDNAQSFAAKGEFIKTQCLRGYTMWTAIGDVNNILTTAINAKLFDE
ncbi:chitinase [Russula brevipes]|nr:chitinase [Russula brevipes]